MLILYSFKMLQKLLHQSNNARAVHIQSVIGAAVLEMDWGRTVRRISIGSEARSDSMMSLPPLILSQPGQAFPESPL